MRARGVLRGDPHLRALSTDEHDEVFHDAWLELWAKREKSTYRDLERQFPTIVRHKALNRLKHDRRHPTVSLEARAEDKRGEATVRDQGPSVEERVERRFEARLVAEIVDSLPERQRKLTPIVHQPAVM